MTKLFLMSHHWKNINKINKYKRYTIEIKTYDTSELLNTEIPLDEKGHHEGALLRTHYLSVTTAQ
jgi:hypothetical protein